MNNLHYYYQIIRYFLLFIIRASVLASYFGYVIGYQRCHVILQYHLHYMQPWFHIKIIALKSSASKTRQISQIIATAEKDQPGTDALFIIHKLYIFQAAYQTK